MHVLYPASSCHCLGYRSVSPDSFADEFVEVRGERGDGCAIDPTILPEESSLPIPHGDCHRRPKQCMNFGLHMDFQG
jgi:hypothetical protein